MNIYDARLDFHELGLITPDQASLFLDQFLENAFAEKYTKVLVITGTGKNSPSGKSVIRPKIESSLKHHKLVKLFKPASSADGGQGAFEVYLKD